MRRLIKRGDVYYADLNPVLGSEQGGIRPTLVISNDSGNTYSGTVIVVALSTKVNKKKFLPTHKMISPIGTLADNSVVLAEQIRTIDKCRLIDYIGSLSYDTMKEIDKILLCSIGIDAEVSYEDKQY